MTDVPGYEVHITQRLGQKPDAEIRCLTCDWVASVGLEPMDADPQLHVGIAIGQWVEHAAQEHAAGVAAALSSPVAETPEPPLD